MLGKHQKDLVKDLDWNKAKASLVMSCKQKYTRDEVNELASYLNIRPFELLLHPDDAMAIRRLREDVLRIAADQRHDFAGFPDDAGFSERLAPRLVEARKSG